MKILEAIDILANYRIVAMNTMIPNLQAINPTLDPFGWIRLRRHSKRASDCPQLELSPRREKGFKSLDSSTAVSSIALKSQ